MKKLLFVPFLLLCGGCAMFQSHYIFKYEPMLQKASNEVYDASIAPITDQWGCKAFQLTVKNKTSKNIEINWNKTLFISQGQSSGGFMFEGIVYLQRNNPKQPDVVFPNASLSKEIMPNNLVEYRNGEYGGAGGWENNPMEPGENGIYLSVDVDGKEVGEKMTISISATPK